MKTKLNPEVFELAAQLLYSRNNYFGERIAVRGCCHAIEWAVAKSLNVRLYGDLAATKPYYKFLDQYFKPTFEDMCGAYWWTKGVKPPRVIALTICAEILREENAKA
jgi:hypothetical protein